MLIKFNYTIFLIILFFSKASHTITPLKAESCANWNDFIHVTDPNLNTDGDLYPYNMRGKMHVMSRYLQYAQGMTPQFKNQTTLPISPYFSPSTISSATDAASGLAFNMFTGMNEAARTETANTNPNNSSAVQIACTPDAKVGSFINTYTANLPTPWITTGGPQTVFGYRFFDGQKNIGAIYAAASVNSYIALQGTSQILTDWHGAPYYPACQLSLVLEINRISTGKYIPFTFKIFDNTNPIKDGATPGYDGNTFYEYDMVSSSSYPINAARFEVPWGQRHSTPWTSAEFSRITFTKSQMTELLKSTGDATPNLNDYQLTGFFFLHEIPNATASLGGSCGAQMQNIGMYVLP